MKKQYRSARRPTSSISSHADYLGNIKATAHISSRQSRACPICSEMLEGDDFAAFNHLLSHGLKLLHIGQETHCGSDGPQQLTIAIFGNENELSKAPEIRITNSELDDPNNL